jgi:hypothetical protein
MIVIYIFRIIIVSKLAIKLVRLESRKLYAELLTNRIGDKPAAEIVFAFEVLGAFFSHT